MTMTSSYSGNGKLRQTASIRATSRSSECIHCDHE